MGKQQVTEGSWLEGLNPAQRQAVVHGDGPLLIVAGAGTGKTKTLACRVAHLIACGVAPDRILLLTFTRRAADEMLRRAERLIEGSTVARAEARGSGSTASAAKGSPGGKVWGGTFHATANRLLRTYGRAVGLSPDFTVMDEGDAADLMNLIRNELGFGKGDRRFPRKETLVKIYSHTVNAQRPLRDVVETHFPWCAEDMDGMRQIFEGYVRRKKDQQVLDYDDLLLFWSALCSSSLGEKVADRFEHVLVDEYQDTNAIQAEVLRGMRRKYNNITVVGDDAQSIYSFRAATIRNILDFPKQFPNTTVVTLEQNYRSTPQILAASNAVMAGAKERHTKELWSQRKSQVKPALVTCLDESEQTEAVCRHILEHLEEGVPLMRQAVLFRAGHHSAMLEVELARRNIPFHKYGGLKFIEAAHIKDMLALLRILENPHDEISWFRVFLWFEGVGPRTARRMMDEIGVRRVTAEATAPGGRSVGIPLLRFLDQPPQSPSTAKDLLADLGEAWGYCCGTTAGVARRLPGATTAADPAPDEDPALRDDDAASETGNGPGDAQADASRSRANEPPLVAQIERIRKFYEPICERMYDNAAARLRDLDQLVHIAGRYRSRGRFITDLTLDPPQATSDLAQPPYLEEDYLILSTIHSAKGCEWDVVHILHAADGMIPSDMAVSDESGVDEERRLFYVAMTRAKDMLYVYFPLRYYHTRFGMGQPHNFAQLTRFLPPPVREFFQQRATMIEVSDDEEYPRLASDKEPYSRVNKLWGD